ncbi:LPS export ABC transporter periplasmic protein LptC [Croceibacterium mercuriale]|nr:LPS export ABC transporter periplasmic protein LptC [Croceibacterium mercuriale]
MRNRRQAFAAPGGSFDRAIRLLGIVLPAAVGALLAMMLIAPLKPTGEVSFLLDRNKVATADDRLRLDDARYRGQDNSGRPFSVSAGNAVQRSASVPVVQLQDLTARLLLRDGPAQLTAPGGSYQIEQQQVGIDGAVRFLAADGYSMVARGVAIDLPGRALVGQGRVAGTVPAGSFSADRVLADLDTRVVTLDGNARMTMVPGQLQLP